MIAAVLGALAGSLGLITILDSITPGDLSGWFIEKIWSVLSLLINPIFDLFKLIFSGIISIVKAIFA